MDSKTALAIGAGSFLLLLFGKRKKKMEEKIGPIEIDYPISENFKRSEFLKSGVMPNLKYYEPIDIEMGNLESLVNNILQLVRNKYGKMIITSGGRPNTIVNNQDKDFKTLLREAGYNPADVSDHEKFAAADFKFKNLPLEKWFQAFNYIKSLPYTRQVILYLRDSKTPSIMHVAVIHEGHGKITGDNYSFITMNGKRVNYET